MKKRNLAVGIVAIFVILFVVGFYSYSYLERKSKENDLVNIVDKMVMFMSDQKYYINISISKIEHENIIPTKNISKTDDGMGDIKALLLVLQKSEHSNYDNAPLNKSYDIYIQVEDGTDHYSMDMIIAEDYGIYIEDSKEYYKPANVNLIQKIIEDTRQP